MHPNAQKRVVLVTGASRGVGAQVARQLGSTDTHVIVNHREHADDASAVVDAIRSAGGSGSTLAADISDEVDAAAMFEAIARRFGRLDALVLTASGAPELGATPGAAMRVNHDAQRRLAQLALPLMPADGHIVFVTSHQAHFYPSKAVPKGYAVAAAGKRAGETALYAMRSDFDRAGIHFTVVSGEMIDGTTVIELLQRRAPQVAEVRRSHASLPTIDEFATAIANAATTPAPPAIVYVGGAEHLPRMSA